MAKTQSANRSSLPIEYYREEDGRWLADIPALPGVTAYGRTRKQATAAVQALALRLIADRLEHGEAVPIGSWRARDGRISCSPIMTASLSDLPQ
ncbi:MAG: type II toxin-antitoxin system HicB family antitoxin [Bryobacteraceae bacterium]|nr:type II toxin-antitoxin system HicB family antitoxin [Bryobacteraceae bacterium]